MSWELTSSRAVQERTGTFRNDEWGRFVFEKLGVSSLRGLINTCLCSWVNGCLFFLTQDIINMFTTLVHVYSQLPE